MAFRYRIWFDSCPLRLLVGNDVVTKDNWRVICTCQRHRARRSYLIQVPQLRGPMAAVVFSTSLLLLGSTYPIEAMNLNSLPLKFPAHMSLSQARPAAAAIQRELQLVTSRVRRQFLTPGADEKHLISERIKEEFFHAEVPYGAIIYREAKRNGLSPELVAAVIETESDFRPALLSSKNAHGLMQLIPSTGALMGATDLFNPAENVRAGTKYLRYLQHRFSDPQMMLAAYNAGEAAVRRYGGIPPYPETQNFVKKVARKHKRYEESVAQRQAVAESLWTALPQ